MGSDGSWNRAIGSALALLSILTVSLFLSPVANADNGESILGNIVPSEVLLWADPPSPSPEPVETPVQPSPLKTPSVAESPQPVIALPPVDSPLISASPTKSATATPSPILAKAEVLNSSFQTQNFTESVVVTGISPLVHAAVVILATIAFLHFRVMRHGGRRGTAATVKNGK